MPSPEVEKRRQYWRDYYHRHPEKSRERRRRTRRDLLAWFQEMKSNLACARCGESDPACIDLHNRSGEEKTLTFGEIRNHGWSRQRILDELARCLVLCANCHRKLHADRFDEAELLPVAPLAAAPPAASGARPPPDPAPTNLPMSQIPQLELDALSVTCEDAASEAAAGDVAAGYAMLLVG